MKNIILPIIIGASALLSGCATTPEQARLDAKEMELELAQNHDGLNALRSSGIKVNFRKFQYRPVLSYKNTFGDFKISKQTQAGLGDLVNLNLAALNYTVCGNIDSSSIEHSTKCTDLQIRNHLLEHTIWGTKKAYDNTKDSLDKIYDELNKIDSFLKPMSSEEREFWGTAFVNEMEGRYTAEELIAALKKYSSASDSKYADMIAFEKAQFAKNEAKRIHDEELAKAHEEQQHRERLLAAERRGRERQQYNYQQRLVWKMRHDAVYTPGDLVCTADNQFGYVETSNSKNTKVLIKGTAHKQPDMFFFGNHLQDIGTEFTTVKHEEIKWFSNSDIASCQIKI
ncbi:hypothetical protein [Thalassotalea maritima]|uniref:hypothetical protein n=1 Tax=Thalassotalea maritima TaxID=3242416 RepID=UPI0035281A47